MAPVIAAEKLHYVSDEKLRLTDLVQERIKAGEKTKKIIDYEATKIYEQLVAGREVTLERIEKFGEDDKRAMPTGMGAIYLGVNGNTKISKAAINVAKSYFKRMSDLIWHTDDTLVVAFPATSELTKMVLDEATGQEMPAVSKHVNDLLKVLRVVFEKYSGVRPQIFFRTEYEEGFEDKELWRLSERITYRALSYRRLLNSIKELQDKGV